MQPLPGPGRVEEDGELHFSARTDDLIIVAGYRIGPFDVESVLVERPAVADAAVIGVPDPIRGQVLEACVVPAPGGVPDDALVRELQQLVGTGFAAHARPGRVHFLGALPRTPSDTVQRYLLRTDLAGTDADG